MLTDIIYHAWIKTKKGSLYRVMMSVKRVTEWKKSKQGNERAKWEGVENEWWNTEEEKCGTEWGWGEEKEAVWLSKTSLLWNSNRLHTDWLLRLIYKCELTAEDEWKQTFWFYCQQSSQAGRHIIYCHVMQVVTVILASTGFVQIKYNKNGVFISLYIRAALHFRTEIM